ncbi:PIG-L family deacetylase [Roseisolibacter agri]|uniref:GlcNAc-PI de-N-acetylase n=1 Tax=Roseisolibacter agri TaxID=2014610 RepID=A0AA37Q3M6_9BACT|nr:PIG-L family deacetylase [Roseisolibacter agri]GLC24022.1 GlcNAc-PI de-N-acetylase [Roseisolibacter agri]
MTFASIARRLALCLAVPASLAGAQERGAAAVASTVAGLGVTTRALIVGAHPDDEDTRLITWLARARHVETSYLSLTRGDGGQNLIGNELGEALGAIRTEELLAARRLDGGRQWFARAFDFGFSKSAEETFRHWPKDSVLGDVVRVVRATRPHVMIAIFSGTPADGHGHHQASGILAREAYDAAADTARFPTRGFGPAWAPQAFYRNTSYRNHEGATHRYDAGAFDPLMGRSYAELAVVSRDQHKSQGQGGQQRKGAWTVSMKLEASRDGAGATAATTNGEAPLFLGMDTSWTRFRGVVAQPARRAALDSLPAAFAAARAALDVRHPEALLPSLARAERLLEAVCASPCEGGGSAADADLATARRTTLQRLHRAVQLAAGIEIDATVAREHLVLGQPARVTVTVYNRGPRPVRVRSLQLEGLERAPDLLAGTEGVVVAPGGAESRSGTITPTDATRPWWLRTPRAGDVFTIGGGAATPEEWRQTSAADVVARVEVDGAVTVAEAPVVHRAVDPVLGEVARPAAAVPAISVTFDRAIEYARAGVAIDRTVLVRLRSADSSARTATVRLTLPAGLTADSAARTVALPKYGAQAAVAFRVRGTLRAGAHPVRAVAESNGERYAEGYQLVDYAHVRPQRLYRPAEVTLQAVSVALPQRARIAYVPGVGDNVAPMLAQLGLDVTVLDAATVGDVDLSRYTTIVVGPRAYEASDALAATNQRLLDWARAGGTLVVQFGTYEYLRPGLLPYAITLDRPVRRVTIEEAPVAALDAAARVLTTPNRIGPADWNGWVQERATYVPTTWDAAFHPVIESHDPGEPESRGALLVAPVGRGTYVYVTLALFRQLPAGNPGAARLFVNLLDAKADAAP